VKVVADTSPIHYLILIDQTDLLAGLFGRVFVPPAVEAELRHPSAPAVVRRTIAERPDWLETVLFKVAPTQPPVVGLHAGERDAILLADFIAADLVLLDERKARRAAVGRGHKVVGLFGLLVRGAQLGMIDFDQAVERLTATNFRLDPRLIHLYRASLP
jgi:predicted nucleic acid-binding protein